jgi:hypothetical protein
MAIGRTRANSSMSKARSNKALEATPESLADSSCRGSGALQLHRYAQRKRQ